MKTPAQIARHPIHPMLITLPIGMFVFALAAQLIYYYGGAATWLSAASYAMAGGIIGGVLAAVPGFIDLLSMPPSKPRQIAIWHMSLNLTVVGLFAVAFALNMTGSITVALIIAAIGVGILAISGWLGGSMVYVHRVAVSEPERLDTKPQPREPVGV